MDSGSRGPALLRRRLEPGQQVTPVASLGSALGPRPSSTSLAGSQVAERGPGHAPRWQTAAARPRGARRNVRTDVRPALRPAGGSRSPEHSRAAPGIGTVVSARARPHRGGGPGRGAGWPDSDRRGRRPPWLRALARPAALRRCHAPCDKPASRSGREARPSAGAVRPAGGNRRSPRSLPPASGAQDQPQAPVSHCETVRERSAQVCLPWDTWVCLPGRGERRRAEPPNGSARLRGRARRGSSWRGVPAGSPTGDSPGPVPEAPVGTPRGSPRGACPGRRDITLAIVLGSGIFPRPSSLPFRRPQMSPFGESYHFLNAVEACLGCPPHPGPATLSEPAEESLVGYGHRRLQSVLVLCRVTSAFLRKRRRLAHLSNAKRGSCLS